jgi:hypothetical protein
MSASPAPTLLPNPVAIWHGEIENISPHASPCRYMPPSRWAPMRESCLDFIARFGDEAYRLGWTAEQLFGVHPEHGTLRVDYCGALMTASDKAIGVEATRVLYERTSSYRNRQGQEWGVPIWAFKAKAG